jgi:hypothetical protein
LRLPGESGWSCFRGLFESSFGVDDPLAGVVSSPAPPSLAAFADCFFFGDPFAAAALVASSPSFVWNASFGVTGGFSSISASSLALASFFGGTSIGVTSGFFAVVAVLGVPSAGASALVFSVSTAVVFVSPVSLAAVALSSVCALNEGVPLLHFWRV